MKHFSLLFIYVLLACITTHAMESEEFKIAALMTTPDGRRISFTRAGLAMAERAVAENPAPYDISQLSQEAQSAYYEQVSSHLSSYFANQPNNNRIIERAIDGKGSPIHGWNIIAVDPQANAREIISTITNVPIIRLLINPAPEELALLTAQTLILSMDDEPGQDTLDNSI